MYLTSVVSLSIVGVSIAADNPATGPREWGKRKGCNPSQHSWTLTQRTPAEGAVTSHADLVSYAALTVPERL